MSDTYSVIRFHQADRPAVVVTTGLTLEEARRICNDPESSSETATSPEAAKRTRSVGAWFYGYTREG